MTSAITAGEVAAWMAQELFRDKTLYQDVVAYQIQRRFGARFAYINQSGNLAIGRTVLKEFRRITEGKVVWSPSERCWRPKEHYDGPGRMTY